MLRKKVNSNRIPGSRVNTVADYTAINSKRKQGNRILRVAENLT